MSSFYDVTTGNTILAADLNQFADKMNGTTAAGLIVSGGASAFVPFTGTITATPGSDQQMSWYAVSADTTARIGEYIRSSDGYGGIRGGVGSSYAANLYAQSSGWKTDQSLTIASALTVAGTTSLAGVTTSGNTTVGGTLTVSGATTLAGFSATGNGSVSGTFSAGATTISGQFTIQNGNTFITGPNFTSIHSNGYGSQVKQNSVSSTGNVTHTLGYTPYMVHTEQSTSGSQTTGHDTVGSTTYHVTLGAGQTSDTYAA